MEDTPRSTNSSGTPRDDRFFSPRENSSRSARTSSSSDGEWVTPRQENVPLYRCNSVSSEDAYYSARYSSRTSYDADQAHQQAQHHLSHNFVSPRTRERQQYQQQNNGNYDQEHNQYDNNDRNDDRHERHEHHHDNNHHNNYSVSPKRREQHNDGYNEKNQYRNDQKYNESKNNESNNHSNGEWNGAITEEDVQDIFTFARRGRGEEIENLLNRGIPVDVKDEWGNTILIIACQNGNKRVAKNVLRRGANINSRNFKGNTPLHYCFHYGYGDTLGQYIIQKGADEGARNNMGKPCWDGI